MRRAPTKPVRACTLRNWCLVSHVTFQTPLRTSHLTVFTLHTTHFTLHSSHCTLRSQHFTSHCTLRTPNFPLHSPHFTLHSPHFTLLTSSFTLQTSHFTLHTALFTPHTSHCTLHTPRFISSELFSPYPTSALLISSLLICHLSFHESLPSTTTTELACAVRQPRPCVRALCEAVAVLLSRNMTCARPRYNVNTFLTLRIALFTPHTPHFTLALHLNSSHLSSSHLIPCLPICQLSSSCLFSCQVLPSTDVYYKSLQKLLPSTTLYCKKSLDKALPSTTLYYKACTKHIPVLLCTTKFAQTTSQYYFVLQGLHKAHSSTTLYYKACTKHVPVLLCTTKLAKHFPVLLCTRKLAQATSQYYFALQSLHKLCTFQHYFVLQGMHKVLPITTLYCNACTNYFPVLLCTTRLAQSPSQYYFVLQSLHKALPSTALYYKKLAQSTSDCIKITQRHRIFCCCTERPMQPQTLPCHVSNSPLLSAFFFGAWSPAHLRSQARAQHLQPFFQDSAICCPPSQYGKTRLHKSMAGSSCAKELDGSWLAQCHASFHVQNSSVVVRSSSLYMLRSPTSN